MWNYIVFQGHSGQWTWTWYWGRSLVEEMWN